MKLSRRDSPTLKMIVRRFVITRVTSTEIHHTKVSLKIPDNNKPK